MRIVQRNIPLLRAFTSGQMAAKCTLVVVMVLLLTTACGDAASEQETGRIPHQNELPPSDPSQEPDIGADAGGGAEERTVDEVEQGNGNADGSQGPAPVEGEEVDEWLEQAQRLDVKAKIGQMVMVGVKGTKLNDHSRTMIEHHRVGGMITFARNVIDASQTLQFLNALKQANGNENNIPLLLGIDEEGGSVSRLPPEMIAAPSARIVGETKDPERAKGIAQTTASMLREYGWNMNFAPVLDVDSNPHNPVIGDRAYGTDPDIVEAIGIPVMKGLQAGGVVSVVKHFPGHGDTFVDSHIDLPLVSHALDRLRAVELAPFAAAIQRGADAVMIGHLLVPALDEHEPATFSSTIIGGLLREEFGFDGVVITDDLTMGAVSARYEIGEAAVKAVAAGADIVMIAHDMDKQVAAIRALEAAVENGEILEDRLDESVARILRLKHQYALSDEPTESVAVEQWNERMMEWLGDIE